MYNFYTNLHPIPLHMVLTLVRWDLPVCAGSISKSLLLPTKTEYKKTEIVSSLLFDLQQEALKGCKIPIPRDSDVILVWNLEGCGSGSTKYRFLQANFREISTFFKQLKKNFDFSRQIFEKFWFFQANFRKISIFQAILKKFRFSRQKLLIYSYFWANNYSISLQKSPLSNVSVYDKI